MSARRILTVVGARPQFVKAAVVSRLIRSPEYKDLFTEFLVHTGQHYDENMSEIFFREMRIPEPDANLSVGSGPHGKTTGEMLARIESLLLERRPDLVLIYGDTNSTLAGALAASKLHIPVAHVEAGLRSFDKKMPEEQNRIIADHLSTWLLCPTKTAIANLKAEGIGGKAVFEVGDVMLDASLFYRDLAASRPGPERALTKLSLEKPFRLLTLHRAENTDDEARMRSIFGALAEADDLPILFPIHPRTRKYLEQYGIAPAAHIRVVDPLGYLDMLELEEACSSVISDSGGVQKEAYFFGKPCVTLRPGTEWVETVEAGWNSVVDADRDRILAALALPAPALRHEALYGDGDAGRRALDVLRA